MIVFNKTVIVLLNYQIIKCTRIIHGTYYYNVVILLLLLYRYGFKTEELNGENEKNQWAENPIHTYLTIRVSKISVIILYFKNYTNTDVLV